MGFPETLRDRYEPERLLAEGGFGSVWLARQKALDRPVAVKTLHAELAGTDEQVQRFRDEARVTAALAHPGIVRLLDFGVDAAVPWMAFEYVEGRSLRGLVEKGPQPWRVVAEIGRQVAAALEEARRAGVVHRDIKPDNVLEAAGGRYKVADFGIAKWAGGSVQTKDGMVLGTPAYLSPVQIQGLAPAHQSDLYALGITLYELLAGAPPFNDSNALVLLEKHRTLAVRPIRALAPHVPEGFERILVRLLAKPREERYESASEVAEALGRLLEDAPASAGSSGIRRRRSESTRSVSVPTRAVVEPAPHRAPLAVAIALVGLAAAFALRHAPPPLPVPAPSAAATAAPVTQPADESSPLSADLDKERGALSSSTDSRMPAEDDSLRPEERARVAEVAGLLAAHGRAVLPLIRRAYRYGGAHPERVLFAALRLTRELLSRAGRVLRIAEVYTLTGDTIGRAPTGELAATLHKLAGELGGAPRTALLGPVGTAYRGQLEETATSVHVVSPLSVKHDCSLAAAEIAALERTRGGPTLEGVLARATLLDQVSHWGQHADLVRTGQLTDPIADSDERRARAELVQLIDPLTRLAPTRPELHDESDSAQRAILYACGKLACDRAENHAARTAALEAAARLVTVADAHVRQERDVGGPVGDAADDLRRAARELGASSAPFDLLKTR